MAGMRFLIKIIFGLALLAVLGVAAIAFLVPTDFVRNQAIALVKQETGRDLTVAGETSFAFYPNIGVTLGDVALSNPPGMGGGPMVHMAALTLDLKLLPLLGRTVEVETFVLVRPVFDLRIDRVGRPNWRFDKLAARLDAGPVAAAAQAPIASGIGLAALMGVSPAHAQAMMQDLRLGEVRIEDGLIHFTDERSGVSHRLEAVNVSLDLPQLSAPLGAKGSLVWQGEMVEFQGRVASLPALMNSQASPVSVTIGARPLAAAFEGTATLGELPMLEGDLKAQTPSARALLHWVGAPAPRQGAGPAALAGRLRSGPNAISFTKARLSLDAMSAQGDIALQLAGARPRLTASLTADKLDLGAFGGGFEAPPPRRAPVAPPRPEPAAQPAPAQGPPPSPKPNQSLTDFIEQLNRSDKEDKLRPTPQVRAWNQRAFEFEVLRAVDADVKIAASQILYRDIKTGRSALAATLKDGVLTANLSDLALYGGVGSGRLTLNAARPVPAVAMRLDLDGVSALPLLKDAMRFDWIAGKAKIALNLSGAGQSQSELVRALQGNGSIVFSDGALVGINIPEMVRGLKAGRLDGWQRSERQQTDFSQLSSTFTMQKGVAKSTDLTMIGPLVRMSGSGTVDLPREWVDISMLPRVVASLEGQGGQKELTGVPVPLKLEGPLDRPKIKPDLDQIMKNPELAKEAVNQVGEAIKNLKNGNGQQVEQLLNNFLGGGQTKGSEPSATGSTEQQQVKPEDLLKNLFRR